jgi:hypothetical protein
MRTFVLTWAALWVCNWLCFCRGGSFVEHELRKKLDVLKGIARKGSTHKPTLCSNDVFVYISEYPWGNSGNHIISLTHGLWTAGRLNATFIIPNWIEASLKHFDLSILAESYCFTTDPAVPSGKTNYAVTSEESFFLFKLFRDKGLPYIPLLPALNEDTVIDISTHYMKIYASLWSSPTKNIVSAAAWIIENYLGSKFDYVSVHKRNLDGGCGKIMRENTQIADFSAAEIAMDSPEWSSDLAHHHPLCEMPIEFVRRTMALNNVTGRSMFVAFDGQGDVSSYRLHKAVFSTVMESHPEYHQMLMKYVDMFVAMLGELFIQNPRSTFSLQIYIIRVCLGLRSVPRVANNDIFLQRVPQDLIAADRPLWVSWLSLQRAFDQLMTNH